jgi:predicted phage tail protein
MNMKALEIRRLEKISGGNDFVNGLCVGIGAGSVVYAIGLATSWWNPVGWVSGAFLVADAACLAYAGASLIAE